MDYSQEVEHSGCLIVRGEKPFNAEPDVGELVEFSLTPHELMYCRNHSPVNRLDEKHFVVIDGVVKQPLRFTVQELKDSFPFVEVVAALQCAGNRRKTMHERKAVKGITWGDGAICNAKWGGVRLRDVLHKAGIDEKTARHVCLGSHVSVCQDDKFYGGSIPIEKAMEEDGGILAFTMNGQVLPEDHGYPLRMVVPGYSGARWIKWLDTITVSAKECQNFYQQRDYKIIKAESHEIADKEDLWSQAPAMQSLLLNSVVAKVENITETSIVVRGYAVGGADTGRVKAVDVSFDRGETWKPADITYQEGSWSWVIWEARWDNAPTHGEVWSRATDIKGASQKDNSEWNLRGIAETSFGRAKW